MNITKEEEKILAGEAGFAAQKSMEILVALGKIYGAASLIDVKSVQVSGVSYKNLGDAGLEFLDNLAKDGKVKVPTTLNPAGMDLVDWKKLGISEEFARKQNLVIDAFRKLGITISCTCTPYFVTNPPTFGNHLAWGESSAVAVANSVFGARTNREGGPSALAAAIVGKTANYGYHLDENRKPTLKVKVSAKLKDESDFGALGYFTGKIVKTGIPLFDGIPAKNKKVDLLKSLSAALASAGGVALFHIKGITPEMERQKFEVSETVSFGKDELAKTKEKLNDTGEPDIICVGCPHVSVDEIKEIARLLKGGAKRHPRAESSHQRGDKKVKTELWICAARSVKEQAKKYIKTIEDSGAKFACDTCMVVAPVEILGFKTIGTNSAKCATYSRDLNKLGVRYGNLKKCVEAAVKGTWN